MEIKILSRGYGRKRATLEPGDYVIYLKDEIFVEIGRVTKVRDDGAYVCYHEGETAALTPFDKLVIISNAYTIKETGLGGGRFEKS